MKKKKANLNSRLIPSGEIPSEKEPLKTIGYYIDLLPYPYKFEAMANIERENPGIVEKTELLNTYMAPGHRNIAGALINAFEWDKSPEGKQYWTAIANEFILELEKQNSADESN